ncbi:hypothetical protein POM88_002121 [Heracleum sosnowskyi]|uniref:Uncharacterized protein n=1 Tax=Heracleum sosnowskyi TaxID=360622 RepID=A0AAD8JF16_9APIA|nr:hypothetical protein POM88_002121 [Heracleum sosnowskyi]
MTISSDEIPSGNDPVKITNDDDNTITINPTDPKFDARPEIRKTGLLVYQVSPDGDTKLVADLRQSPQIGEVTVEDWAFQVRINYGDEQLYVLLQRFKLCFVGFRASNGGWILPKGEYRDRVLECVEASFPASDINGNFIEPKLVDLDMSYRSLSKISNVPMTDLILNEQSFITAVVYLKDASLGNVLFDNRLCALHLKQLLNGYHKTLLGTKCEIKAKDAWNKMLDQRQSCLEQNARSKPKLLGTNCEIKAKVAWNVKHESTGALSDICVYSDEESGEDCLSEEDED